MPEATVNKQLENTPATTDSKGGMTPKQIVSELDKYIIGQNGAKRAVAVAIRNRWRRRQLNEDLAREAQQRVGDLVSQHD